MSIIIASANLLIKKINQQKMNTATSKQMASDDIKSCKKQHLTQNGQSNDAETEKGTNLHNSSVQKVDPASSVKQTACKRIKLKQHLKTEISPTPKKIDKTRLKTSPNRQSPRPHILPLREQNMNTAYIRKHKTNLTEFFPINEVEHKNTNHFKTMYTELCPSPKKLSLPYSRIHKESLQIRQLSKSQERSLSKSKKKIHFTVFESKQKSKSKSKQSPSNKPPTKSIKTDFSLPYRYNSTITINLFQHKNRSTSKSKSKDKRSASKKSNKSISKSNRSPSLQKKTGISKNLIKSLNEQQSDERVNQTLEKLKKYKFVSEYIEKWEILQKIQGYSKSNEPECKWALLIVDQVFKRIREDNKFEALVSRQ